MNKNGLIKGEIAIVLIFTLLIFYGCAAKKVAIFQSKDFVPSQVDVITLLPVVDLRIDKTDKKSMEKVDGWMLNNIEKTLKKSGYKVKILTERSLVADLTEEDIKSEADGWIQKQEIPGSSNWILVTGLSDAKSKLTFGSTGNAEVTGYFYNKSNGSIIWHDKGIGQTGQGGLIGMAMKGTMYHDAVILASANLIASFPMPTKK